MEILYDRVMQVGGFNAVWEEPYNYKPSTSSCHSIYLEPIVCGTRQNILHTIEYLVLFLGKYERDCL